jgi:hypothetical protein
VTRPDRIFLAAVVTIAAVLLWAAVERFIIERL